MTDRDPFQTLTTYTIVFLFWKANGNRCAEDKLKFSRGYKNPISTTAEMNVLVPLPCTSFA